MPFGSGNSLLCTMQSWKPIIISETGKVDGRQVEIGDTITQKDY